MSSPINFPYPFLNSLLSKAYTSIISSSCDSSLFPWTHPDAFISDWLSVFFADTADAHSKLTLRIGKNPSTIECCLNAFESLTNEEFAYHGHSAILEEIYHLKRVLACEVTCSDMLIDDDKISDTEDSLQPRFSPKGSQLSGSLPDPIVEEMINELPEEPTTSILSFSTDQRTGTCEDLKDAFDTNDLQGLPIGSQVTIGKKSICDHYPPAYLIRKSRKGVIGHPKKEYFRCQHIRALKKSIRQIKDKKIPKASIHMMNSRSEAQKPIWEKMKIFFETNKKDLVKVCCTEEGPLTDGKKKRKESQKTADSRSFNNGFCYSFFSNPAVRKYNSLFSDLVYAVSVEEMCKKIKARCCEEAAHTPFCEEVWRQVHNYARDGMIRELGLEVLDPERDLLPEEYLISFR